MPRIAGVDIPTDKPIWVSLTYIYGIGRTNSRQILKEAGIDPQRRAKDLTEDELAKIIGMIDKDFLVEGALRRSGPAEHRPPARHRQLPRQPASPLAAGSRPAHAIQRPHPQGPAQDRRRQEGREGTRQVVVRSTGFSRSLPSGVASSLSDIHLRRVFRRAVGPGITGLTIAKRDRTMADQARKQTPAASTGAAKPAAGAKAGGKKKVRKGVTRVSPTSRRPSTTRS